MASIICMSHWYDASGSARTSSPWASRRAPATPSPRPSFSTASRRCSASAGTEPIGVLRATPATSAPAVTLAANACVRRRGGHESDGAVHIGDLATGRFDRSHRGIDRGRVGGEDDVRRRFRRRVSPAQLPLANEPASAATLSSAADLRDLCISLPVSCSGRLGRSGQRADTTPAGTAVRTTGLGRRASARRRAGDRLSRARRCSAACRTGRPAGATARGRGGASGARPRRQPTRRCGGARRAAPAARRSRARAP